MGLPTRLWTSVSDTIVHVCWQDGEIFYAQVRLTSGGSSTPVQISKHAGIPQWCQITAKDNIVFLSWEEEFGVSNKSLVGSFSSDGGRTFSVPKVFASHEGGSSHLEDLTISSGQALAVWSHEINATQAAEFIGGFDVTSGDLNAPRRLSDSGGLVALRSSGRNIVVALSGSEVRRSIDGGRTFSEAVMVKSREPLGLAKIAASGNDVFLAAEGGPVVHNVFRDIYFRHSRDGGASFSEAQNLSLGPPFG